MGGGRGGEGVGEERVGEDRVARVTWLDAVVPVNNQT